jgi:hypothetical protein
MNDDNVGTMLGIATQAWEPFAIPHDTAYFEALDFGRILRTGSPLEWCLSLARDGDALMLDAQRLNTATVSPFLMEALTAQSVACMENVKLDAAVPLEAMGRIVLVDITPYRKQPVTPTHNAANKEPRYACGDPPVPMLFLSGLDRDVVRGYHRCIQFMLTDEARGKQMLSKHLEAILAEMVGKLTRSEVMYFMVKAQSLSTGAYRMRFLETDVIPPSGGIVA